MQMEKIKCGGRVFVVVSGLCLCRAPVTQFRFLIFCCWCFFSVMYDGFVRLLLLLLLLQLLLLHANIVYAFVVHLHEIDLIPFGIIKYICKIWRIRAFGEKIKIKINEFHQMIF